MKKLKRLSDVPGWFDIKNYDKARSLGPEEWLEQIRVRGHLPQQPLYVDLGKKNPRDGDVRFWKFLNQLKTDPIFKKRERLILDVKMTPDELKDLVDDQISQETRPVVDYLIVDDLGWINFINSANPDKELLAYCNGEPHSKIPRTRDRNKPVQLLSHMKPWVFPHQVAFIVNPQASNEQLYEAFMAQVEQARKDFDCNAPEKMFTDKNFKAWCKYEILAYFDLTTWAKCNGVEFTDALLAAVIFPDDEQRGFSGENRISKETKRRAAMVFNINTYEAMRIQVEKRTQAQKSPSTKNGKKLR